MKLGSETEGSTLVDVLRGLLHAIGEDSRDALISLGFDMMSETSTYDQAMAHLRTGYVTKENICVKIMKVVTGEPG